MLRPITLDIARKTLLSHMQSNNPFIHNLAVGDSDLVPLGFGTLMFLS
jgi:hypothetical protein